MNRRGTLVKSLAQWSHIAVERIVYYDEADGSVFKEVRCGIVFVLALWSGAARLAFRKITEVIDRLDPLGVLQFVVVNIDGVPDLYETGAFAGRLSGSGEAAWVQDGQVVGVEVRGDGEAFERKTAELLTRFGRLLRIDDDLTGGTA